VKKGDSMALTAALAITFLSKYKISKLNSFLCVYGATDSEWQRGTICCLWGY